MGFADFFKSDEDIYGAKSVAKRKEALKMKELRSGQAEHDLFLKKQKAFEAGEDPSKVVPSTVDKGAPSTLAKGAAAASIAQQMGALPSEGGLGGAVSGAATGAAFGVPGAIVGGIAGAVMGSASAAAARKAENRRIEAQKHRALGEIKQQEGQQIANVLAGMGSRMKIY
jgi:hypothetical protein